MYIYICKRMLVTKQCWYTQTSAISPSLTSLLLYPKTQGMYILYLNLPPCCHISLSYITNFDIRVIHQEFKPHACTHHVVIIVINVINAMLILCYSIMSHATLILFYHAYKLTLYTSLISHALWLPHACYQGGQIVLSMNISLLRIVFSMDSAEMNNTS